MHRSEIVCKDCNQSLHENSYNRLILGDNLSVMERLLGEFRGAVDCIYLDPPFDVGSQFSAEIRIGDESIKHTVFNDQWAAESQEYRNMAMPRLKLAHELLSEKGCLFLHCDYRTTAMYRTLLDELFGRENYVNEIIWFYKTGGIPEKLGFGKKHDTIHYYVKNRSRATWNPQKEKSYLKHKYGFSNIEIQEDQQGLYTLVNCRDVIDIPALRGNQPERVAFPTQKPEALLERLILATTNEGDLVADFFCGSGTTGIVAQKLGRRWILADKSEYSVQVAKKRMLELVQQKPDESLPFGVYSLEPTSSVADIKCEIVRNGDGTFDAEISEVIMPISSDLAAKGLTWRNLISSWAVDFDYQENAAFCGRWHCFENSKSDVLKSSARFSYPSTGAYTVAVQVVDIFGRVSYWKKGLDIGS